MPLTDKSKIELLRDLLLSDDRKVLDGLSGHLDEIDRLINTKNELEPKINPIIDEKLEVFQESIPEKMGPAITAALKKEIAESQDQVVDILYPIIGKMIKKYLRREMEMLVERIDTGVRKVFSFKRFKQRIKRWFLGQKESDELMKELIPPSLVEMYVIEKDSGILKGHFSNESTLDKDMVAGMLTAIKSFVEDAFNGEEQTLEMIEYNSYKIQINTFRSFYIAVVISGVMNAEFKTKLDDAVLDFAQKYLNQQRLPGTKEQNITTLLNRHFHASDL